MHALVDEIIMNVQRAHCAAFEMDLQPTVAQEASGTVGCAEAPESGSVLLEKPHDSSSQSTVHHGACSGAIDTAVEEPDPDDAKEPDPDDSEGLPPSGGQSLSGSKPACAESESDQEMEDGFLVVSPDEHSVGSELAATAELTPLPTSVDVDSTSASACASPTALPHSLSFRGRTIRADSNGEETELARARLLSLLTPTSSQPSAFSILVCWVIFVACPRGVAVLTSTRVPPTLVLGGLAC